MFMNTDTEKVDLILLIVEDLGGTATDERGTNVNTTMLNFLDGNRDVYRVPTMIVATTNYLDQLQETLTSRPGRFDVVTVVKPPKFEEICFLVESCVSRQLTAPERKALEPTGFTPAYCIEAVVRSELYDITLEEAVAELQEQRERAKSKSHMTRNAKMGFDRDDEDY
jgi:SpoVK/Ycf46/Vps4 family AAA+-type ATPase